MSAPARWPNQPAAEVAAEPTPIYDALREWPTADPWRRAFLRDVLAGRRSA